MSCLHSQVDAFFKRHYGPQSLTVTIVGDVDPAQASPAGVAQHTLRVQAAIAADGTSSTHSNIHHLWATKYGLSQSISARAIHIWQPR